MQFRLQSHSSMVKENEGKPSHAQVSPGPAWLVSHTAVGGSRSRWVCDCNCRYGSQRFGFDVPATKAERKTARSGLRLCVCGIYKGKTRRRDWDVKINRHLFCTSHESRGLLWLSRHLMVARGVVSVSFFILSCFVFFFFLFIPPPKMTQIQHVTSIVWKSIRTDLVLLSQCESSQLIVILNPLHSTNYKMVSYFLFSKGLHVQIMITSAKKETCNLI